jgi:hypothetical protein
VIHDVRTVIDAMSVNSCGLLQRPRRAAWLSAAGPERRVVALAFELLVDHVPVEIEEGDQVTQFAARGLGKQGASAIFMVIARPPSPATTV